MFSSLYCLLRDFSFFIFCDEIQKEEHNFKIIIKIDNISISLSKEIHYDGDSLNIFFLIKNFYNIAKKNIGVSSTQRGCFCFTISIITIQISEIGKRVKILYLRG